MSAEESPEAHSGHLLLNVFSEILTVNYFLKKRIEE